jgi:hypothetical protein
LTKQASSVGYCFAFVLLSIDHRLADLLIRSVSYKSDRMDRGVRAMKDTVCNVYRLTDLPPFCDRRGFRNGSISHGGIRHLLEVWPRPGRGCWARDHEDGGSLVSVAKIRFAPFAKKCPRQACRRRARFQWHQEMCCRAGNLCVGLDLAITKSGEDPNFGQVPNRIASYPVGCSCGPTRSVYERDARWDPFSAPKSSPLGHDSQIHAGARVTAGYPAV